MDEYGSHPSPGFFLYKKKKHVDRLLALPTSKKKVFNNGTGNLKIPERKEKGSKDDFPYEEAIVGSPQGGPTQVKTLTNPCFFFFFKKNIYLIMLRIRLVAYNAYL